MRISQHAWAIALLSGAVLGCSSGSGGGSSTGGTSNGGSSSGAPITLPGGQQVPSLSCGSEAVSSALGTWDVVASNSSTITGVGTIVVKDNQVSVTSNQRRFAYQAIGGPSTVEWASVRDQDRQVALVKRTPADLDVGVFPVSLGGTWILGEGSRILKLTISDGEVLAEATRVQMPRDFGGAVQGTIRGSRTESRTSIFGRLGGVWRIVDTSQSEAISVVIDGNTFTVLVMVDTKDFGKRDSWITLKVCNDGAVGKTSLGVDVAAVRR